jgi:hypothetical protein
MFHYLDKHSNLSSSGTSDQRHVQHPTHLITFIYYFLKLIAVVNVVFDGRINAS